MRDYQSLYDPYTAMFLEQGVSYWHADAPCWEPSDAPRRRKPSLVERRGRAAGLHHWQVAFGVPHRMDGLCWLDKFFNEEGWQVEVYDLPQQGRWPLRVNNQNWVIPTRFLLDLTDAVAQDPARFRFGLQLYFNGKTRARALQHVRHCVRPLAQQRLGGLLDWAEEQHVWLGDWSPKAMQWLARQPAILRWALLHQTRPQKSNNGLSALNWDALAKARKSTRVRLSYLPPNALWKHITGASASGLQLPCLEGFKFGTLQHLCREFKVSPETPRAAAVQGWLQPLIQLVRLFGDYQSIRRFVTVQHPWSLQGLHDAGQFRLPADNEGWTPAKWAPLCLRHPQAVELAQHFATVESRGVIPRSWTELRQLQFEVTYTGGAHWAPLKVLCGELGLSNREYLTYQTFWESVKVKPADFMPYIDLNGASCGLPGWRLVKLHPSDLRGPMLGAMTGCCQHLNGAGRSCARHGVTSPFSAFYVVERNGVLVAQSWVWRNDNGGLVLDSVETKDRTLEVAQATARLWQAAAPQLLGQLGVTALHLGESQSGVSSTVFRELGCSYDKLLNTLPADSNDYYDGRTHACWAGKRSSRKDTGLTVEGYTRTKAVPKRRLVMDPDEYPLMAELDRADLDDAIDRWGIDGQLHWMRTRDGEPRFWGLRHQPLAR